MNILRKKFNNAHILVVGSGVVGKFIASELSNNGFKVTISDPDEKSNSSNASLGVLMGRIYKKRSGRAWKLRERSLKLWPKWINILQELNPNLMINKPLIQLTTNDKSFENMKNFININPLDSLKILDEKSISMRQIQKIFRNYTLRGIVSYEDGRINPQLLLNTLDIYLQKIGTKCIKEKIIKIDNNNNQWTAISNNGERIIANVILLCNSINSINLVDINRYNIKLQPVLGQAIELEDIDDLVDFSSLPKIFSIDGKNFIPLSKRNIILGSTDENNFLPKKKKISELIDFMQPKPPWLNTRNIKNEWFGVRSRPVGEGSPILKTLEKGLILCSGFYKNGILLAPACSEWISKEIHKHI